MSQDDSFEAGLDREQTRIKREERQLVEGMTTGINGTTKFIWQIWPCGKLYWEAFYRAVEGRERQNLANEKTKYETGVANNKIKSQ